eukprot:RCo004152
MDEMDEGDIVVPEAGCPEPAVSSAGVGSPCPPLSAADEGSRQKVREELQWVQGSWKGFLRAVRQGDLQKVRALLRHSRLLACFGFVDAMGVKGTVMASFAGEDLIVELLSLTWAPHLCLWTDLLPGELSKLHGCDWQRHSAVVALPILEALRAQAGQEVVEALLEACPGMNLRLCSPDDMYSALHVAVVAGHSGSLRQILRSFSDVHYRPAFVYHSRYMDGTLSQEVVEVPWKGPTPLQLALRGPAAVLLQLMVEAPVTEGAARLSLREIMHCLRGCSAEDFAVLFHPETGALPALAVEALQVLVEVSEVAASHILRVLPGEQAEELLFTSSNAAVVAFLVRFASASQCPQQLSLRAQREDRDLLTHHIAAGHVDVVAFLLGSTMPHTKHELERWEFTSRAEKQPAVEAFFVGWKEQPVA